MVQCIIGHRGAAGFAPENTLKSIQVGCESVADAIEIDVHLSKDGELVVIHDNTLDRTTTGTGWVRSFTLRELKGLDAGQGEKIPTLDEVVDLVRSYHKQLIVEIKGESSTIVCETARQLHEFIKRNGAISDISIHSFWHGVVKAIKKAHPNITTAAIMMVGLAPFKVLELTREAEADGASMAWDYVSSELVELFRKEELRLDAFTLNEEVVFNRIRDMGVTGLITNYPGRFQLG